MAYKGCRRPRPAQPGARPTKCLVGSRRAKTAVFSVGGNNLRVLWGLGSRAWKVMQPILIRKDYTGTWRCYSGCARRGSMQMVAYRKRTCCIAFARRGYLAVLNGEMALPPGMRKRGLQPGRGQRTEGVCRWYEYSC